MSGLPWLIAFCGRAGAGKSTAAGMLSGHAQTSIGAPIKRIARSMGWNGEKDEAGRRLLQLLGMECGRECIGQHCWLSIWKEDTAYRLNNRLPVVVDDIRFDNEAREIHHLGGLVLRVTRPGEPTRWPWSSVHPSERGVSECWVDATVENKGNLSDLRAALMSTLGRWSE